MKSDADVNIITPSKFRTSKYTAVTYAAANGRVKVLQAFRRHGTDFNTGDRDSNPLMVAVLHDQAGAVDVLIKGGADVDGREGVTPLMHSVGYFRGRFKNMAMKTLLFHGAKIPPYIWVPIFNYQGGGFVEAIDILLRSGVDEHFSGGVERPCSGWETGCRRMKSGPVVFSLAPRTTGSGVGGHGW